MCVGRCILAFALSTPQMRGQRNLGIPQGFPGLGRLKPLRTPSLLRTPEPLASFLTSTRFYNPLEQTMDFAPHVFEVFEVTVGI